MTRTRESNPAQDRRIIVGVFFVSACLFMLANFVAYRQWQLNRNGLIASGEVIDITGGKNGKFPIVRFTAQNGQTHTFREQHSSAFSPMHYGDHVDVIYRPDRPQDAYIVETQWLMVWVLTGMASMLGCFGLLLLRVSRWEPVNHP